MIWTQAERILILVVYILEHFGENSKQGECIWSANYTTDIVAMNSVTVSNLQRHRIIEERVLRDLS